jgi:hypothetical protein
MQGDRFNKGKPQWGLVPFKSLEPMVRVLEYGATKYSPYNWQKGQDYVLLCESLLRHTFAFLNGEDNDPESGLSHAGHMACNTMMLNWMIQNRPDLDNRMQKDEVKSCYCTGMPKLPYVCTIKHIECEHATRKLDSEYFCADPNNCKKYPK